MVDVYASNYEPNDPPHARRTRADYQAGLARLGSRDESFEAGPRRLGAAWPQPQNSTKDALTHTLLSQQMVRTITAFGPSVLALVYAFPTMSTRPCQRRGTRPRGLLGPTGAVLPVVTFSPTINSLSRVDFALGATNSAR